eukprot:3892425-Amphidinium_carterae.1
MLHLVRGVAKPCCGDCVAHSETSGASATVAEVSAFQILLLAKELHQLSYLHPLCILLFLNSDFRLLSPRAWKPH